VGTGLEVGHRRPCANVFLRPLTETTGAFIDKRNDHVGRSVLSQAAVPSLVGPLRMNMRRSPILNKTETEIARPAASA
jgi:hypothetical protein